MSDRRKAANIKNKTVAYVAAGVVHAVIIGALLVNFTSKPKQVDAAFAEKVDVVKATTVDESAIKKQQEKLLQAERDRERKKKRDQKRLDDLKKQTEQEKKQIKDLKVQQVQEKKKAVELEQQRKQIALKKQREEEQRKKELALRQKREAAERQRKLEEERQLKEAERIAVEQQALETQRLLNESLAAEEAFVADQLARERTTTMIQKYSALIQRKVAAVRTIEPDFERWRVAEFNIKLSPLGEVSSVRLVKSSGSERYDRSVETAILKASPLPIPDLTLDPNANNELRNITANFPMPGT